jgi:hypothetical protein
MFVLVLHNTMIHVRAYVEIYSSFSKYRKNIMPFLPLTPSYSTFSPFFAIFAMAIIENFLRVANGGDIPFSFFE